jgi:succinate dehydrogenase hydrophobic anchor subunit
MIKFIWILLINHISSFKSYFFRFSYLPSTIKHVQLISAFYQFLCLIYLSPLLFLPLLLSIPLHIQLGFDEVIEDYVHDKWSRSFCQLFINIIILITLKQSILLFLL